MLIPLYTVVGYPNSFLDSEGMFGGVCNKQGAESSGKIVWQLSIVAGIAAIEEEEEEEEETEVEEEGRPDVVVEETEEMDEPEPEEAVPNEEEADVEEEEEEEDKSIGEGFVFRESSLN